MTEAVLNHRRTLLIEALGIDSLEWERKYWNYIAPIVNAETTLSEKFEQLVALHKLAVLSPIELAFISYVLGESKREGNFR